MYTGKLEHSKKSWQAAVKAATHSLWTGIGSVWPLGWKPSTTRGPDSMSSSLSPPILSMWQGVIYRVISRERNCWKFSRQHCITGLSFLWMGPEEGLRPVLTVGWGLEACSLVSSVPSPWYCIKSVKPPSEARLLAWFFTSSNTSSLPGTSRGGDKAYRTVEGDRKGRQKKITRNKKAMCWISWSWGCSYSILLAFEWETYVDWSILLIFVAVLWEPDNFDCGLRWPRQDTLYMPLCMGV